MRGLNVSSAARRPGVILPDLSSKRAANAQFAEREGYAIAAEFTEVETGKGADALDRRPQLAAALAEARRRKCPIVVAKLDRLSRDRYAACGSSRLVSATGRAGCVRPIRPPQRSASVRGS
jgi:DNA invertase Pin-like site-specific DNA recombinase